MRNVRPSWVAVYVDDDRKSAAGPRSRDGSLRADFSARIHGEALRVLTVTAEATRDGSTVTYTATNGHGQVVWSEEFQQ